MLSAAEPNVNLISKSPEEKAKLASSWLRNCRRGIVYSFRPLSNQPKNAVIPFLPSRYLMLPTPCRTSPVHTVYTWLPTSYERIQGSAAHPCKPEIKLYFTAQGFHAKHIAKYVSNVFQKQNSSGNLHTYYRTELAALNPRWFLNLTK